MTKRSLKHFMYVLVMASLTLLASSLMEWKSTNESEKLAAQGTENSTEMDVLTGGGNHRSDQNQSC